MIKSSNILKMVTILIFGICFISSCKLATCEECSEYTKEELRKIGEGDVYTYKSFMKKHPDPYYSCCNRNSIVNSVNHRLENYVIGSNNLEIIKDFFKYDLSQTTKNEFLHSYWTDTTAVEITRFLIENNAKLHYYNFCDSSLLLGLKSLHKFGYDMNYIDPKTGRNLFLDYSAIGYEKEVFKDGECAVECLKYLKSIGVDTKLKDVNGKTALELASDPIIIDYLKGI
ncbi:MAG: hypothetical protein RI943_1080 [Bacteroidota bacterium]